MRRAVGFLVWAALVATPAAAQEVVPPPAAIPVIVGHAPSAVGFTPPGFELESQAAGDLNQDGRTDLVLVFRGHDPALVVTDAGRTSSVDTNPRVLAVVLGNLSGGFDLALQNATLIPRRSSSIAQDYLEDGGVSVAQGVVQVSLQDWLGAGLQTWDHFGFVWRGGRLRLITYGQSVFNRGSGQTDSLQINYLTGIAERTVDNDFNDEPSRSRHRRFHRGSLLSIEDIGDGVAFNPRVPPISIPQGRTGG